MGGMWWVGLVVGWVAMGWLGISHFVVDAATGGSLSNAENNLKRQSGRATAMKARRLG